MCSEAMDAFAAFEALADLDELLVATELDFMPDDLDEDDLPKLP